MTGEAAAAPAERLRSFPRLRTGVATGELYLNGVFTAVPLNATLFDRRARDLHDDHS